MEALAEARGEGFVLTTAPETAFVQGGFAAYGGIWGAYLPVIHALRDRSGHRDSRRLIALGPR